MRAEWLTARLCASNKRIMSSVRNAYAAKLGRYEDLLQQYQHDTDTTEAAWHQSSPGSLSIPQLAFETAWTCAAASSQHICPLQRSGPRLCGLFISVCIAGLGFIVLFGLCELFANTDYILDMGGCSRVRNIARRYSASVKIFYTHGTKTKRLIDYNC